MLEQIEKSERKSKKNIPKGCFQAQLLSKYVSIKNYLQIKDMYTIVAPFRYQFLSYVVVRRKDPADGDILELYHQASRKLILKAVPRNGQIGCKYLIFCPSAKKLVGRVRGDLLGNRFFVYDGGNNPSKKKFPSRKELAYVYTTNAEFFSQKPPNLTAVLANHGKRMPDDDQIERLGTLLQAEGIIQLEQTTSQLLKAQKQNSKRAFTINSVQPVYCPSKKGYMMDLKGLINEPSLVNMVMKTQSNQDCLVMGKRANSSYLLYVGNPLTLLQGFGIFLANLVARKQ